jgi:hypothetical protein
MAYAAIFEGFVLAQQNNILATLPAPAIGLFPERWAAGQQHLFFERGSSIVARYYEPQAGYLEYGFLEPQVLSGSSLDIFS